MNDLYRRFDQRCDALRAKHIRMADGFVTRLDGNGVLVQAPVPRKRGALIRALAIAAITIVLIKAMILAEIGVDQYARVEAALKAGGAVEQAIAFVMRIDPATAWVAGHVIPLLP